VTNTKTQGIRLFNTEQHPCSYLPDKQATLQFVDPKMELSDFWSSTLNDNGFRRSGAHYYRPQCVGCSACKAMRIRVADFSPSRSQQRCIRKNRDLEVRVIAPKEANHEQYYPLFAHYIETRHQDGDMYPPSREQFSAFLGSSISATLFLEFYKEEQLVMVAQSDQFSKGLSCVYTFFDTTEEPRGLGNFAILKQIEITQTVGLDFLFLGYWVEGAKKMSYKKKFKPNEVYCSGSWQRL
jgi:arginyl-tRNA--protein-N-Asp/Glu arginylyltransferase